MTKVWSWEEMDYVGEDEPRLLPDLWIEPGATCEYCDQTGEASSKPLAVQCGQCGGVAHFLCAVDCNPDPYEYDEEYNDFVCGKCLNWTPEDAAKHAAEMATPTIVTISSGDVSDPFFDDLYELP